MENKVSPIPKGYHTITIYLTVKNAAKAIDFYKDAFNAVEVIRKNRPGGKIGHAEIKIGDSNLMLADEFPELGVKSPEAFGGSPVGIFLYVEDVDTMVNQAVKLGATLIRPVENMFYGDRSGAIKDPFGHTWYISTHIEDVSDEELEKRAAKIFG